MAGICLLHNDPQRGPAPFAAFAALRPDVADLAGSRRAKIWELSANLHCSIVGTCLTAGELRQFFVRLGDADARAASDHALHGRGVRLASRREDGGKLLNKALDKRHEAAIRRCLSNSEFVRARSSASSHRRPKLKKYPAKCRQKRRKSRVPASLRHDFQESSDPSNL
jgi:hypothetical protein